METTSAPRIRQDLCKGDGFCTKVCSKQILQMVDKKAKVIESLSEECIACGQCIAACPVDAIDHPEFPAESFEKLKPYQLDYEDLHAFLSSRRSVRTFKKRPVEREVIEKIVEAAAFAPMGTPPHSTEVVVLDEPAEMELLQGELAKDFRSALWVAKNPLTRPFFRWQLGAETYHTFNYHVIPLAEAAVEAHEEDGADKFMYHAPALMIFHANRWITSYEENAHLVCTYAMLAAHSLGLGTTILGMVPPIVDRSKLLRDRYGIPKENKVITSMILGYPKCRYHKSIKRALPSLRFLGSK